LGFLLAVSGLQISLIKGVLSIIMGEHIQWARRRRIGMDLIEAIKGRRSIRKYKADSVPEEALQVVMEAVRWAPSWANTQCWKMIVVKDSKMKSDVAGALSKNNPALSSIIEAPVLLILCGMKGISGFYKDQPKTEKGDWLMFDVGLAMENLCLTAHTLGLGTVIVGNFDHRRVAEILEVPQNIEVVAMTPLGYPASDGPAPRRKEISEFVFYEKYKTY
jgi:nitroreductase